MTAKTCLLSAAVSFLCLATAGAHLGHGHVPPPVKPAQVPPLSPGTVAKSDPVLNGFQSSLGLGTGGISYDWTVLAVGNFNAQLSGIVGASSWSDPEQLSFGEGHTRAGTWVALNLRFPSRVTLRLSRAAGILDPLGLLPGETGGATLVPAFTLYRGWQGTGSDAATFPNQGVVPWAPSLAYLSHHLGGTNGLVEASFELPAGSYSLVFGGVGSGGYDSGRQGYVAALTTVSRAPAAAVQSPPRAKTKRSSHRLRGRFRNPDSAAYLVVQQNRRRQFLPATGAAWSVVLRGLKAGPNYVYLTAISLDGRISPRKRVLITRATRR